MAIFYKIINKLIFLFKLHILQDPFLINIKKWFADSGDDTLRLDYPLNETSIVFDVGGYLGDYSSAIYDKFGCRIYLFEPVPEFYEICTKRFNKKHSITCLNYGLSSKSGWFDININNNESSFKKIKTQDLMQQAQVRSITEIFNELCIEKIDLIKINIEGGEFDLLPEIIKSGLINKVRYIQVQFHNFHPNAANDRLHIRTLLSKTHREMWNYEFVWESWELR